MRDIRSTNSIRNISYSLIGQVLGNLLSFINRTVFIHTIGVSYLGINGLFASVFSLLSLADLGIGSAIAYSLYEPIVKKDTNKINILMELYAKAYKIIAGTIASAGIVLIPFLPYIIKDIPDIPYLRIYYLLMLSGTVFSYLFAYKRTLLLNDQKAYINTKNTYQFLFLQTILQILLLVITKQYALYLIAATICTIASNISISVKTGRIYPYLKDKTVGKLDKDTKNSIIKNVFAMMLHKISGIIVYSSDNIVISSFIGISAVGIYSNYYMIMQLIINMMGHIFTAITASVANLYIVGTIKEKRKTFETIYFINFWMVTLCTVCFYFLLDPFITLWIGEKYLLDRLTTVVLVIWFYNQSMRYTVGVFKNTAGLYWNDRFKPIFESIINLAASVVLLKIFGIAGVFMGTITGLMTTSFWVEPYIVYKYVLKQRFRKFFITYFFYMGICFMQIALIKILISFLSEVNYTNFIRIFFICIFVPNICMYVIFRKSPQFKNALAYGAPIYRELIKLKNRKQIDAGEGLEMGDFKMDSKKVGIVIVTYNRITLLKKTLEHIKKQSYRNYTVYLMDNASTDGTKEFLKEFVKKNPGFKYYRMKTNLGGAGGFYHGIKLAYAAGADYIWGMDDDAFPDVNALELLINTISRLDEKTCLVSNTVRSLTRKPVRCNKIGSVKLQSRKSFLFLGFFIPRSLINDIGYPRKDLFIYFDDIDYSNKAIKAGYQIYMVKESLLQHPDMMAVSKKFTVLGKKYNIQKMPSWKWYYYMRNGILIYPKDDIRNKLFRKYHLKTLIGVFFTYPKCFYAALEGYLDGKRGITGKSKKFP